MLHLTLSKICSNCNQVKSLSEFYVHAQKSLGRDGRCKDCCVSIAKAHRSTQDKNLLRHKRYMSHYGMSPTTFYRILAQQGDCCAICKVPLTHVDAHIDHDHSCCPGQKTCGECVRGILCMSCNHMLGKAKDDVLVLQAGIEYLNQWRK